jgi:hypothetical protein
MQATVFGLLPDIWRLLVAWGAPGRLEEDQELLRPLWTILSSCLEMCSGAPGIKEEIREMRCEK